MEQHLSVRRNRVIANVRYGSLADIRPPNIQCPLPTHRRTCCTKIIQRFDFGHMWSWRSFWRNWLKPQTADPAVQKLFGQ